MRLAIGLAAAAVLAPCVSVYAQYDDPDAAYYAGQEEQRGLDADKPADRQLREMQWRDEEQDQRDAERLNRELEDSAREQELQRMRNELTDMQTQQMHRQSDDEPR